jgi:hypothetical protein
MVWPLPDVAVEVAWLETACDDEATLLVVVAPYTFNDQME